ncbi:MAG: TonB-dependent receptor [Proteobacteria bacterium]|nr:TonB-dependent receptor [Pseudomonadota bacterium]
MHSLDIPAQDLGSALKALAAAADEQILFSPSVVAGRRSSSVKGDYTTDNAVAVLLKGTGLRADRSPGGVILVRAASANAPKQNSTQSTEQAPTLPSAAPDSAKGPPITNPVDKVAATAGLIKDEVVVTGSHLRSQYTASTPIQVVTVDEASSAGIVGAQGIVALSPAASGTQQVNNLLAASGAGGAVSLGGTNINSIALRNLGATRTLTLLDGRRLTPAGVGSQVGPVDLNVLPSSIIDRVEVLTDGASSIYGSDAVAGVVNIITKRAAQGLELNVFGADSQHGGGRYEQASLFWGRELDRGFINVAAEYNEQDALEVRQRPQTACAQNYVFDPSNGQRLDLRDPSGQFKCRNLNPTGVFFDQSYYFGWFQYDPMLSAGRYPAAGLSLRGALPQWVWAARPGYPDTYPYANENSSAYQNADVISPLRRLSLYSSAAYKLTDDIELYGNALFNQRTSSATSWMFLYPVLDAANPNNTVSAGLIGASGGQSNGNVLPQMNMPFESVQSVRYAQASIGARGALDLGRLLHDGSWELTLQYGRSYGKYAQDFFYQDRLNAATGAGAACNPALITVSGPTPCASIPWLDPQFLVNQNWTAAQRNFLQGWEWGHTTYALASLEGLVKGALLPLPAGSIDAALGFSLRFDDLDDVPGLNAQRHNYFEQSTAGVTRGNDTVREVYVETGIPLLADLPLIHRLALSASGRYTDYRSYGSGETHKLGLNWEVTPSVSLRGTYGTSFRAPTLYELFLGDQTSFYSYFDPCVRYGQSSSAIVRQNCAAQGLAPDYVPPTSSTGILGTEGGGAGQLKAETSTNLTYGVVFRPTFADLQVALDYYAINVRNEIATYGVDSIILQCYGLPQGSGSFCDKITRDPLSHAIIAVDNQLLNIAQDRRRGIDLTARYETDVRLGHVTLESRWTHTLTNEVVRDTTSKPEDDNGLSGNPKTTGLFESTLAAGRWKFYYGFNYIGPTNDAPFYAPTGDIFKYYGGYAGLTQYGNPDDPLTVRELLRTPAYVIHHVSAKWQFDKQGFVQVGIKNLLDKQPPVDGFNTVTYRIGSVPSNLYDFAGRTVFVQARMRF